MGPANSASKLWRRRDVIKLLGTTAITGPIILRGTTAKAASSKVVKIGHVSSPTGVFASFAEADPFILDQIRTALGKGISNGGVSYEVQIISKDSQSSINRASEVASELILKDKVDLLVSSGSPETTNAVADQAEANEVPCITGMTPWQPYFFGRHGIPDKGFTWTYHFAFGLEDIIGSFLALWKSVETNKVLGALFPNDIGGNAWADAKHGFPGQSAKELCDAYEHSTGRPWTQPIGFQHALFEVAIDVLKRAKNLGEPASILEAIVATDYHSIVGPIKWSGKPVKNVSKTPLVAGQWRKSDNGFELVISEDATAPNIQAQDKLRLLS